MDKKKEKDTQQNDDKTKKSTHEKTKFRIKDIDDLIFADEDIKHHSEK